MSAAGLGPAGTLLDLIHDAGACDGRVTFVPSGTTWSVGELWDLATVAAGWLEDRLGAGTPVAVTMDSSAASIATFLAACRGGRRLVSLPGPPRGSSLGAYRAFVDRTCELAGADVLVTGGSYLRFLTELARPVESFEAVVAGAAGPRHPIEAPARFELVQFTSGSTSDPKGVQLPLDRITANIRATLAALRPEPGDAVCSWLPLSHDMGLIGMTLGALCAGSREYAGGGELVLIQPEWFLRRPEAWLETCASTGATMTAAPDFGFQHAVRRGPTPAMGDLSRLRVCITGAEPVRASTLRAFTEQFTPLGFDDLALCPAYGLAEAGLAVTITRPDQRWRTITVDDHGRPADDPTAGTELVSAGPALDGYALAVDPADGRLRIAGPSLATGYLSDGGSSTLGSDGGFETNDAALLHDGELYVLGRLDDVVVLAGRNLYLTDLESAATRTGAAPADRVQAMPLADGFAIVAERVDGDHEALARELRRAVVAEIGLAPAEVLVVKRGALPRTPSGKPRRAELPRKLARDDTVVLHRATFGP